MDELMIKAADVSKQYRLGQIGRTTLREELQRFSAKIHGREDPTRKIGARNYSIGETFMALDCVSFEITKGERVGIIGHNGAGKSTLLKLISRITAPTGGWIGLNGRVTSMLEVGTGFHKELTGRENIYMNGAILGMKRKEIDAKLEDIIDFSECRQFIDTPVKRYSSGMYVKLAFSVAAHLDSEIMIMDEVLAVGDMAFQKKCIEKMNDVSREEGRTILYVSHNMNTIRQLCDRVIVLDHGKLVFDGDTEQGIDIYLNDFSDQQVHNDFTGRATDPHVTGNVNVQYLDVVGKNNSVVFGEKFRFSLTYFSKTNIENLFFRITVLRKDLTAVATAMSGKMSCRANENNQKYFELDVSELAPGEYTLQITVFEPNGRKRQIQHDIVPQAVSFTIYATEQFQNAAWNHTAWGSYALPVLKEIVKE